MISPSEFWKWFEKNNAKYFFLNQITDEDEKEEYLNEFYRKLHEYSDKVFFQIGGHPDEVQDLIITADGNVDYFDKVEELVNAAPKLKNWNIIAFKPPADSNFTVKLNDVSINPKEVWFYPLENKKKPSLLGLRLFIDNYSDSKKNDFINAAYLMLDSLLGEKINTLNIHHVEVANLPIEPDEKGLIPLTDLPSFVKRKISAI